MSGNKRAEYGKGLLKGLSARLTKEFGKGFDESNVRYIRQFYLTFPIHDAMRHESSSPKKEPSKTNAGSPETLYTLRRELKWTHYRLLIRVEKSWARAWYMNEAGKYFC